MHLYSHNIINRTLTCNLNIFISWQYDKIININLKAFLDQVDFQNKLAHRFYVLSFHQYERQQTYGLFYWQNICDITGSSSYFSIIVSYSKIMGLISVTRISIGSFTLRKE